jgi:hypothetical protein
VQTAGDTVRSILVGFAKLAARVQRGEDHLHGGYLLARMHVDRNAAAVIDDFSRSIFIQGDRYILCKSGEAFVGCVIDNLDQRVVGVDRIGVHAGPMQNRRQVFQYFNIFCGIGGGFLGHE